MKLIKELFITFAKIGMFTFGGGYTMIPLIEHECVDKKHWITSFMDSLSKYDIAVKVFKGIRIAVGFLIAQAGITMVRKMMKKRHTSILLNF